MVKKVPSIRVYTVQLNHVILTMIYVLSISIQDELIDYIELISLE